MHKQHEEQQPDQGLLSTSDVATLLHVSPDTVRHWAKTGKLRFVTTNDGHRRFRTADIDHFRDSYERPADMISVLIVDDNKQHAELMSDYLHSLSNRIETDIVQSGFDADDLLHTVKPDLVLLDLMMPGLEGDEVCRKIKNTEPTKNVPVFVLTGFASDENVARVKNAGADLCLSKPVNFQELSDQLERRFGPIDRIAD